jgi:hypothetical protein
MVQRLIGKNAISATELARETGVREQNLSRWLAAGIMGDSPGRGVKPSREALRVKPFA